MNTFKLLVALKQLALIQFYGAQERLLNQVFCCYRERGINYVGVPTGSSQEEAL